MVHWEEVPVSRGAVHGAGIPGRGVGTSVIERAHERADKEGLVSYLQGTASATPFYVERGWKAVERFEVNLKDWVKGDGLGFGIYKVGYMIRLPVESKKAAGKEVNEIQR